VSQSLRLPPSDCRELLRLSGLYRVEVEAELARELEHDTEPCPAPDDSPGPGARLVVDPTALRHQDADRMARLVALANTHDPALADAPSSGPLRTTLGERTVALDDGDEVLERLRDDTEPMLSSDRQWPGSIEDDPDDDDDPDERIGGNHVHRAE
jgi:hypothetical protein